MKRKSSKRVAGTSKFYSVAYVAADLEKSPFTLANWRSQRRGPPWVKVGKHAQYPVEPYHEWKSNLPLHGGA